MRIVVFGTGGVGGYFGARLAEMGEEVMFVARGQHLEALQAKGLRLLSVSGDLHLDNVSASSRVDATFRPDLVIMCVKAWQIPEAAAAIEPVIGDRCVVMPLQNGVEAPSELGDVLGSERVIGALCGLIAFIESPGVVRHTAVDPYIRLGELDNSRTERLQGLVALFDRAHGVDVDVPEDINAALWMKFLFISPTGGIGAITRAPMGIVRSQPESRELLRRAMREVYDVAVAKGIALPADAVEQTLAFVDGLPASSTSSMQRDLMNGRPSELQAQIGAVTRLGRDVGVATPVNDLIYASLLASERRARGELEFEL